MEYEFLHRPPSFRYVIIIHLFLHFLFPHIISEKSKRNVKILKKLKWE